MKSVPKLRVYHDMLLETVEDHPVRRLDLAERIAGKCSHDGIDQLITNLSKVCPNGGWSALFACTTTLDGEKHGSGFRKCSRDRIDLMVQRAIRKARQANGILSEHSEATV